MAALAAGLKKHVRRVTAMMALSGGTDEQRRLEAAQREPAPVESEVEGEDGSAAVTTTKGDDDDCAESFATQDSDDEEEYLLHHPSPWWRGRLVEETLWAWLTRTVEVLHPHPIEGVDPPVWFDSNRLLAVWYFIMAVQLAYTITFLPIRMCFEPPSHPIWVALDALADLCCLVDLWVTLRTAVSSYGFFITDRAEIWARVKWRTAYDVACLLPADWLAMAAGKDIPLIRLNRLLRCVYYNRYFAEYERFNPGSSVSIVRLVKSSTTMMLVAHLLGCGYFLVLRLEGAAEPAWQVWDENATATATESAASAISPRHPTGGRSYSWQGYHDLFELSVMQQYLRSFYWAFITMTGYGNTIPVRTMESVYSILVVLLGLAVYVNVIGTVGSMVSALDAVKQAHDDRLDTLFDWMKYRCLPAETQAKVREYYEYMWGTRKGVEEQALLADLPQYLRLEVSAYINSDIIQKVPLFKDVSREFLNAVLLYLEPRVVLGGNSICKTGDVGAEMFFISTGSVNVVIETGEPGGKVVAVLNDGCFFGEVALIYQTKRTATVVAHTVCELYILEKCHFEEVLDEFPEYAQAILQAAAERYKAAAPQKKVADESPKPPATPDSEKSFPPNGGRPPAVPAAAGRGRTSSVGKRSVSIADEGTNPPQASPPTSPRSRRLSVPSSNLPPRRPSNALTLEGLHLDAGSDTSSGSSATPGLLGSPALSGGPAACDKEQDAPAS
eukprot:TRINITY_DN1448_c0_g2_i1.p1 TRINITY_DN1448_c0_g2~~TRINITY_DN1448_c0_g2_i1.p1  ORF type:complete len:727 (+),score=202.87 TRINITY_DN1448_c0_g2_i1:132-2312(+)